MKKIFLAGLLFFAFHASATDVAITVDDLPVTGPAGPGYTRRQIGRAILDAFKRHATPPIYGFVNGITAADFPEGRAILEDWVADGHPLANHTYSHFSLEEAALSTYLADIDRNEPLLTELSKGVDFRYFRYPFLREGATSEKREGVRAHLAKSGYRLAHVTVDFGDYLWNKPMARCLARNETSSIAWLRKSYVEAALSRLKLAEDMAQAIFGRPIPHVLLLHIGVFNAVAMDDLLSALKARQDRLVELPVALKDEVFAIDPGVLIASGANFLDRMARAKGLRYPPHSRLPTKELDSLCR